MVEYEIIGVLLGITGLISYQIRFIDKKNDREHAKLWSAVVRIADHLGLNLNSELKK